MNSEINSGEVIAVWGSKGSGKTTTAAKIAAKLAANKKEVILILTDIIAPDIHVLLPELKEKDYSSMGDLWSNPDCKTEVIYKSCITTKSKYLGILTFKRKDNVFSYPDYTKDNIIDIFMKLKNMADYIVVDCVDTFAYNVLTMVALELADKVIRLGEATIKSFSFFESNLILLQDSRYKSEQHYKVLSRLKSHQAKDVAIDFYGGIQVELPFVDKIEKQMLEGEMFELLDNKAFKSYNQGLEKIVNYIMEVEKPEEEGNKNKETASFFRRKKEADISISKDKKSKKEIFRLKRKEVS